MRKKQMLSLFMLVMESRCSLPATVGAATSATHGAGKAASQGGTRGE